jgi:hypothetical protein
VPALGALPEGTAAPFRWSALSIWRSEPSDEGLTFEQRVQLRSPSDRVLVDGKVQFSFAGVNNPVGTTNRVRLRVPGFPLSEPGEYTLRLSLRAVGQEVWSEVADYPIVVSHVDPGHLT